MKKVRFYSLPLFMLLILGACKEKNTDKRPLLLRKWHLEEVNYVLKDKDLSKEITEEELEEQRKITQEYIEFMLLNEDSTYQTRNNEGTWQLSKSQNTLKLRPKGAERSSDVKIKKLTKSLLVLEDPSDSTVLLRLSFKAVD